MGSDAEGYSVSNSVNLPHEVEFDAEKVYEEVVTNPEAYPQMYTPGECSGYYIDRFEVSGTNTNFTLTYGTTMEKITTGTSGLEARLDALFAEKFGESPLKTNFKVTSTDGNFTITYYVSSYGCNVTTTIGGVTMLNDVICGCTDFPASESDNEFDFSTDLYSGTVDAILPTTNLDIHISNSGVVNINAGIGGNENFTVTNLIDESQAYSGSGGAISLNKGYYRVYSADGLRDVTHSIYLKNLTYYYYDDAGNLVAVVPPNAVDLGSSTAPGMVTTYQYNVAGELISQTTVDAGETQYLYRKDGLLRFSQNAKQRVDGKFSYTDYDRQGRIIEVGEFVPTWDEFTDQSGTYNEYTIEFEKYSGPYNVTTSISHLIDNYIHDDLPMPEAKKTQRTHFQYDVAASDYPIAGEKQHFTLGKLSKSWNDQSATWYSYDELGRVVTTVQQTDYSATRIDYAYDFLGNVQSVVTTNLRSPRKDKLTHLYSYDANKRLIKVEGYVSSDVADKKVLAQYEYFQHGPLKRVALGDELQGVDYFYTINGWLKGINNPNHYGGDPGNDGQQNAFAEDVFSQLMHYYDTDYTSNEMDVTSTTNPYNADLIGYGEQHYNGLVHSVDFHNLHFDGAKQSDESHNQIYAYEYDHKYQLHGAQYGTMDYGLYTPAGGGAQQTGYHFESDVNSAYELRNLTYDDNGNIGVLRRHDEDGDMHYKGYDRTYGNAGRDNEPIDKMVYTYHENTNQIDVINSHTEDPVGFGGAEEHPVVKYTYNEIGQVIAEFTVPPTGTAESRYMEYDVYGKPTVVWDNNVGTGSSDSYGISTFTTNVYEDPIVKYYYDERGFRIRKDLYDVSGGYL